MRALLRTGGLAALLIAATLLPAAASAQTSDPERGSPSGVIYEIPLDDARRDASPRERGVAGVDGSGRGGATATGVLPMSSIRSENGFGSSSTVPGAPQRGRGGKSAGAGSGGSGSAGGSTADGGGTAGGDVRPDAAPAAAAISPSKSRAYLLLALVVAVAAALGLAGRRLAGDR